MAARRSRGQSERVSVDTGGSPSFLWCAATRVKERERSRPHAEHAGVALGTQRARVGSLVGDGGTARISVWCCAQTNTRGPRSVASARESVLGTFLSSPTLPRLFTKFSRPTAGAEISDCAGKCAPRPCSATPSSRWPRASPRGVDMCGNQQAPRSPFPRPCGVRAQRKAHVCPVLRFPGMRPCFAEGTGAQT